ncbi:MspA family porin [Nocardia sp. CY41]|uniref:MspA family porin n=1 Tax=Nocardia sp. CY41 TaxID=2608686 RepID=UPI00135C2BB1|nr:MspA family porin [Nocardia sp. CY41]
MMNRKHSRIFAAIIAVVVAATGSFAVSDSTAGAEPGEAGTRGLHVIASVDYNNVVPGGDVTLGVPFAHAVKVSGDFSVVSDGPAALRRGQIVAGYLIGCAVDISDGIQVSIAGAVGAEVGFTPGIVIEFGGIDFGEFGFGAPDENGHGHVPGLQAQLPVIVAPTIAIGADTTFGVNGEVGGEITVNLAPGSVTAAVIAQGELDRESTFPFTFAHTNTPLNVNGCLSPASAMPFVTVRAEATNGIAQTTGYGPQFVF